MAIVYDTGVVDYGVFNNPQVARDAGVASGIYKFNTPDGGVQDGYYLSTSGSSQGGDFGWVLIGRYAADASSQVTATMNSVRGLDDISTSGNSVWSADWGHYKPLEVRFMGHTNASDILGNRTIDWIYRTGNINQTGDSRYSPFLWEWLANMDHGDGLTSSNYSFKTTAINGGKQGIRCRGARDGRGRWDNSTFSSIRISDNSGSNYVKPAGLTSPTSSMWYYHAAQDAKWAVSASDHEAGQDTDSSAMFGWDDGNRSFYDEGTGNRDQNSNERDYSSCVLVWMR